MDRTPILSMEHIDKSFPGVHALDDVHFQVYPGEILALMGENGAGKSTLMKILIGVYRKDRGRITLNGTEIEPLTPHEAFTLGISVIHQELNLVPEMMVFENVFLGRETRRKSPVGKALRRLNKMEMLYFLCIVMLCTIQTQNIQIFLKLLFLTE